MHHLPEIRVIPGFIEYGTSEDGRIWSRKWGKAWQLVKPQIDVGYLTVKIYENGKSKRKKVHRLVYEAWKGPINKGILVNHIDGHKENNHLSNLEAVSPSENTRHAYRHGLIPSRNGINNPNSLARKRNKNKEIA